MEIIVNPERRDWGWLTSRATHDGSIIEGRVQEILKRVKKDGDKAVLELTKEIDGVEILYLELPADIIKAAEKQVSDKLKAAIQNAADNIRKFHEAQLPETVETTIGTGIKCIQRPVAINRVGIYIPGGTAPLFSTVLMLAIPARIAGCKEIILCTPPSQNGIPAPEILYSAALCGIDRIFIAGGAQAIAAMGYGTQSIPKVDKIFGPGNRYVTKAKQLISVSDTAIDMPAGPSEVMILADGSAVPEFIAADMLSQAEHGADSQAILICDSRSTAERVAKCVESQIKNLSRIETVRKALSNSRIVVMDDIQEMIDFANEYAAEHLIISMSEAWTICDKITAAGSIFIGNYSPESVGDYASGTNHTLPTAGWAKSYSGVNIDSFMKKITIQELNEEGLRSLGDTVITMAEAEGLDAHANAVKVRLNY